MKTWSKTLALLVLGSGMATAEAAPLPIRSITLDGNLSDWGISLANNNGSNIHPNAIAPGSVSPCTSPGLSPVWACEDSNDNAGLFDSNGGYVGPEYGGQKYDVEFLGAAQQGNTLFVGIASGLRPDNGFSNNNTSLGLYGPGDLFLTVNGTQYVVEMGGGAPHSAAQASLGAQTEGSAGSYYVLDSNGYTQSVTSLADQVVGSIWRVSDGTLFYGPGGGSTQWLKNSNAMSLGVADVYSTRDSLTGNQNQHSVFEVAVDMLDLLPVGSSFSLDEARWGPTCFNDVLSVSATGDLVPLIPVGNVPEPASALLLAAGGLVAAMRRRRLADGSMRIGG